MGNLDRQQPNYYRGMDLQTEQFQRIARRLKHASDELFTLQREAAQAQRRHEGLINELAREIDELRKQLRETEQCTQSSLGLLVASIL